MFKSLPVGSCELNIVSAGFKPFNMTLTIKDGLNEFKARLMVREVKETVEVRQKNSELRLNDAFNEVLREEEILSLFGKDVASDLRQRYGEDITFEVDGFEDGSVPSKEQIASIKIIKNSFDAEYHRLGQPIAKITTKAGYGGMTGFFSFSFMDYRFNARHPFETERLPSQDGSLSASVGVPIKEKRASLNLQGYFAGNTNRHNIIAAVPGKVFENSLNSSFLSLDGAVELRVRVGENQHLKVDHKYSKMDSRNLGVGGFNLPERGYSNLNVRRQWRFFSAGILKDKYIYDFKLAYYPTSGEAFSRSSEAGVAVLDAFNAGGAGVDNESQTKKFLSASNWMFDYHRHLFKFGFLVEYERRWRESLNNTNGLFIFTDLDAYLNQTPAVFRIRDGSSETDARQTQGAVYVNDDVRLAKNLQIGFGLRYERQTNIKEHNFSPRLSFTYSPFKSGRLVLRGGAGVFYDWFELADLDFLLSNDGSQAQELIIDNPSFPHPFGANSEISNELASIRTRDADVQNPYTVTTQASFNLNASKYLKLEGTYTYQKGVRKFRSRDINALAGSEGIRPNPALGQVISLSSIGSLLRRELELKASGAVGRSSYFVTYRLASEKSDYGDKFGLPANNDDLRNEWGYSSFDRRNYLSGMFFMRPLGNIRLRTSFSLASPAPYTVTTGLDNNSDGVFNDRPPGVPRNSRRGAWTSQVDVSVGWERYFMTVADDGTVSSKSISFEASIKNVFNRSNLHGFVGNKLSPFFGKPTFASQPRSIELDLRFSFF